jgi:hypothetical protein
MRRAMLPPRRSETALEVVDRSMVDLSYYLNYFDDDNEEEALPALAMHYHSSVEAAL